MALLAESTRAYLPTRDLDLALPVYPSQWPCRRGRAEGNNIK
jgi:hypothetical protein